MSHILILAVEAALLANILLLHHRVNKLADLKERVVAAAHLTELVDSKLSIIEQRLLKLEMGAQPDYEKAKEAAKAMNEFTSGLTAILNYDPYAALKASRDPERGGDAR